MEHPLPVWGIRCKDACKTKSAAHHAVRTKLVVNKRKNDGAEKADNERIPEVKTSIAVSVKRSTGIGNFPVIAIAKITERQMAQNVESVV